MGAAALVAEYNGVGKAPHIVDELTELAIIAELVYASGVAAAAKARRTTSGIYEPKFIYSNTGRYLAGINVYHEYDILSAIAGGLPSTLPPEEDWLNPETGPYLEKYISRNPEISSEKLHRLFRFISDFSCSASCGWAQYAGVHGGGSPVLSELGVPWPSLVASIMMPWGTGGNHAHPVGRTTRLLCRREHGDRESPLSNPAVRNADLRVPRNCP